MKAIIIEEDRFAEISAKLILEKESLYHSSTPQRCGWDKQMWPAAVDEAHRQFHFHWVRWAQSQGASCLQR